MKGVEIVALLLLSVLFLSCRKEEGGKDLTIIFATTTGLADDAYNEPLMRSIYEYIVNTYGKSKGWPSLDHRYLTKNVKHGGFLGTSTYNTFVNLETGEEGEFDNNLFTNQSWYRVFIYWFKPDGDKIEYW